MFTYKIFAFNKENATMTVAFDDYTPYNYSAPRANGVYLSGEALEVYIQNLHPTAELTDEILASQQFEDDLATITGGEDIQAKYDVYLATVL